MSYAKLSKIIIPLGLEGEARGPDGHLGLGRGLPQADGALPAPGHGRGPQLHPGPAPKVCMMRLSFYGNY